MKSPYIDYWTKLLILLIFIIELVPINSAEFQVKEFKSFAQVVTDFYRTSLLLPMSIYMYILIFFFYHSVFSSCKIWALYSCVIGYYSQIFQSFYYYTTLAYLANFTFVKILILGKRAIMCSRQRNHVFRDLWLHQFVHNLDFIFRYYHQVRQMYSWRKPPPRLRLQTYRWLFVGNQHYPRLGIVFNFTIKSF